MRALHTALIVPVLFQPFVGAAEPLDIKGLRIGMTRDEVREAVPSVEQFTVAGIKGKYPIGIHFHEDKLDRVTFFFDASNFEAVLEALKGKYVALRCETSNVVNGFGARFEQQYCATSDETANISILRFTNDLSTSALGLNSKRSLRESEQRNQQRKKDI